MATPRRGNAGRAAQGARAPSTRSGRRAQRAVSGAGISPTTDGAAPRVCRAQTRVSRSEPIPRRRTLLPRRLSSVGDMCRLAQMGHHLPSRVPVVSIKFANKFRDESRARGHFSAAMRAAADERAEVHGLARIFGDGDVCRASARVGGVHPLGSDV
eukprot:4854350-Prymnesium_polylepis.1